MRKIRIIEHISLDGVIQAPGGPGEDTDNDYKLGGWSVPFADPALGQTIIAAHGTGFDLLLGRRTYDIWAAYWPKIRGGPIADGFNAATKYVATHRPESLAWGPAKGLGGSGGSGGGGGSGGRGSGGGAAGIVEDVRRVKAEEGGAKDGRGGDLILWGSSTLAPVLLGAGLVDEVLLLVYPVLLGTGKRFFGGTGKGEGDGRGDGAGHGGVQARELALVSTKTAASGVLINTYRPVGALRTGSFAKPPV